MKFTCDRDVIIKEFQTAQEIVSSRNALSILSYVLIKAEDNSLQICATDLKVSFETTIPVEVQEPGTTTVFCDKLLGILRSLPVGEVQFELKEHDSFVINPVFKTSIDFRLKNMSAEKYPEIRWADSSQFFSFKQSDFIEMVSQTVFAVSDDETRYFMNGVYLEKKDQALVMVATDGRRLSYISKEANGVLPDFTGVIIPPKMLNLLKKLASGEGEIQIAIADKHVYAEFDNQKISSALIDGQFPNYQRVIPEKQEYVILVDRTKFSEALRRVGLMVEKSRRIYLQVSQDNLALLSEESELGFAKEDIEVKYQGPEAKIALNFQYLNDPLRVIHGEELQIQFTETNRAISLFSVPESDYFHIIMPMQTE